MPRTARAIVAGYCYHLINRGNNRAKIFHETADYAAFLSLVREASGRLNLAILAACLMPNHVHFVVQPERDSDMSKWAHWLFTTHVRHYHGKYGTVGRVWQGRFKAFAIEQNDHLIAVLRYVERNALRAGLASTAESWLWGSLRWRLSDVPPVPLRSPPFALPADWLEYVNAPQTPAEVEAIRQSVNRQRPYGSRDWTERTAAMFGLTETSARIGRPRKHT